MSLFRRIRAAAGQTNIPVLIAGAALAATYLVAAKRERRVALGLAEAAPAGAASRPARPRVRSGWPYWKDIGLRTYNEINDDRLLALAAGVVFYALLALFPAITALVSSYALFAKPSTILSHLTQLSGLMPSSAFGIVSEQVNRIVGSTTGGLSVAFVFGLALALWSANAGIKAIIDALNIVYGVKERRSFVTLNVVSLIFTVGAIVAMLLAFGAIVVVPLAFNYIGLGGYAGVIMLLLRWPALILVVLLALAVLYRFGPDLDHPRWRVFTPGAMVATVAWLAGSALLSFYLGRFANYDATYGSLGAGIGLMMWLWLTAIVVLVGAELNSVIDEADAAENAPFPGAGPDRIGGL